MVRVMLAVGAVVMVLDCSSAGGGDAGSGGGAGGGSAGGGMSGGGTGTAGGATGGGGFGTGGGVTSCPSSGDISNVVGCLPARPECDAVFGTWLLDFSPSLCGLTAQIRLTITQGTGCTSNPLTWGGAGGGVSAGGPNDCGVGVIASQSRSTLVSGQCFGCSSTLNVAAVFADGGVTGSGIVAQSGDCSSCGTSSITGATRVDAGQ